MKPHINMRQFQLLHSLYEAFSLQHFLFRKSPKFMLNDIKSVDPKCAALMEECMVEASKDKRLQHSRALIEIVLGSVGGMLRDDEVIYAF